MEIKDLKKLREEDKKGAYIKKIGIEGRGKEENKFSFGRYWSKFWFLLWKDNSLKGWIFSVLFLFVFIKLIFFPVLNLITGTSLPLAIVESCSMYHDGNLFSNYDSWWQRHELKYNEFEIEKTEFQNFKFKKGFNKGDILFIIGAKPEKLKGGDVIIFEASLNNPVIHRIINIQDKNGSLVFSTLGDNNPGQLPVEKEIHEEQLVGKAVFRVVPYAGWGKLIAVDFWNKLFRGGNFEYIKNGFCEEN